MGARTDWHELSRRAGPAFLAFVVLTWAWAWREGADRPAPDLDPFLKRAWPGAQYAPLAGGAFEVKRDGRVAILAVVLVTAVFVSRPFCNWVCPVDTTEQIARYVRVRALRRLRRETGVPRLRRPIRLRVASGSAPAVPVFRRLRNGALTAAGLLCAFLVLGHLHERLSAQGRGAPEGLLGRTFVSTGGNR